MSAQEQRTMTRSSLLCLLPFALGILLWGVLPDELLLAFGPIQLLRLPKHVAVVLIPLAVAALQMLVVWMLARRSRRNIFGSARMSPWLWVVPITCALTGMIILGGTALSLLSVPRLLCLVGAGAAFGLSYLVPTLSYGFACAALPGMARSLCAWRRSSRTLTSVMLALTVAFSLLFLLL